VIISTEFCGTHNVLLLGFYLLEELQSNCAAIAFLGMDEGTPQITQSFFCGNLPPTELPMQ
jgi:hypothetical protein